LVVLGSVIGGYAAPGGHLAVLFQPFEFLIIIGAAVGGFIIANPVTVLKRTGAGFGKMLKGPKYGKQSYVELLSLLYLVFKLSKTKGMLALEAHVDHPQESEIFARFPSFMANRHAQEFLCDYLRLMTLGTDNPHELEALMDQELETHHQEAHRISHALQQLAEAFPGLGIVAAVLGVIKTMGAITEPPAVLGGLIGAALVGTFLGILLCYGFVGPMATALKGNQEEEHLYFVCIKAGLIAHLQGYAPAVSVEFARKVLQSHTRPSFQELEEATQTMPAA
ncbi:MAG: flagellar motor stator protein MotA, partial [Geminicoccales bacterium]